MDADKKNLLLLFDRPQEPAFVPKGPNQVAFAIPQSFLADRYSSIGVPLINRYGEEATSTVAVKEISLPNLGEILDLERNENFSIFIPKHRALASKLIRIFLGMRNWQEFQSMAIYARDRVNPYLFNYCFSVALLHRPDTQDLDVPALIQSFPDKMVDSKTFRKTSEETFLIQSGARRPILLDEKYATASDLELEHRVAYFREDIGINLHHWHWHLVYPFGDLPEDLPTVQKDRRGELFYYMHQQIIARYNAERLSNKLTRVSRYIEWRKPIEEAYFPKLTSLVSGNSYPSRAANQTLQNLSRETQQIHIDIDQLDRWRDRIFGAIHAGFAEHENGTRKELTEKDGIDILGNMIEASILSPNRAFYGSLHNMGHNFLSYVHDPDNRHLESFGVIGDSATAMRDPIFYRWHAYIDSMFQEHKGTLPRYSEDRLKFDGIAITGIEAKTDNEKSNELTTFWQQSDVDLTNGLDFQAKGSSFVRFTHLQHNPFKYTINVSNTGAKTQGTCRIFIAPATDERGNPWLFQDQKGMFIELDKFVVELKPGSNVITRRSTQSSVTIPFERTFRNLNPKKVLTADQVAQFNFCGCGWPHHMLLPKGSPEGLPCNLFVMISNYANDRVDQDGRGVCNDAASYCGIKDKLYPDRQSMGYPFDRSPREGVKYLQQFLTANMRVQNVSIRFTNRTMRLKDE